MSVIEPVPVHPPKKSAEEELREILSKEDECHPGLICLDEIVEQTVPKSVSENWRSKVVWCFSENEIPEYIQGKAGENEICSEITAEEANGLIRRIVDSETQVKELEAAHRQELLALVIALREMEAIAYPWHKKQCQWCACPDHKNYHKAACPMNITAKLLAKYEDLNAEY